jgi:hypothetical protein
MIRALVLDLSLSDSRPSYHHYCSIALTEALRVQHEVESACCAEPWMALALAREQRCNLLIALGDGAFPDLLLARLCHVCGTALLWLPLPPDAAPSCLPHFDRVFVGEACAYAPRAEILEPAASEKFSLFPVTSSHYYDVFHACGRHPLPDASGRIWRMRATRGAASEQVKLPDEDAFDRLGRVAPRELARFANRSLASVFDAPAAGRSPCLLTLIESALAGSAILVEQSLLDWLPDWLPERDLLAFDSHAMLVRQLADLRQHPQKRAALAQAAQAKVQGRHLYLHRASRLLAGWQDRQAAPSHRPLRVLHLVSGKPKRGREGCFDRLDGNLLAAEPAGFAHLIYTSRGRVSHLLDHDGSVSRRFAFPDFLSPGRLTCKDREAALAKVLIDAEIDVVHVHDLAKHVPSLPIMARALGVPVVWSAHDYRPLCHNADLIDYRGLHCTPTERSADQCDTCLERGHGFERRRQGFRRTVWNSWLGQYDALVFPNALAWQLHADLLPEVARHRRVIRLDAVAGSATPGTTSEVALLHALYLELAGDWRWRQPAGDTADFEPLSLTRLGYLQVPYRWTRQGSRWVRALLRIYRRVVEPAGKELSP